jgi:hypothetical protein
LSRVHTKHFHVFGVHKKCTWLSSVLIIPKNVMYQFCLGTYILIEFITISKCARCAQCTHCTLRLKCTCLDWSCLDWSAEQDAKLGHPLLSSPQPLSPGRAIMGGSADPQHWWERRTESKRASRGGGRARFLLDCGLVAVRVGRRSPLGACQGARRPPPSWSRKRQRCCN